MNNLDVITRMDSWINKHCELVKLLNDLSNKSDFVIVGGFIRDHCLKIEPKDIDIMTRERVSYEEFEKEGYNGNSNSLGGLKLKLSDGLDVDIWCCKDHLSSETVGCDFSKLNEELLLDINAGSYNWISKDLNIKLVKKSLEKNEIDLIKDYDKRINLFKTRKDRFLNVSRKTNIKFSSRVWSYMN